MSSKSRIIAGLCGVAMAVGVGGGIASAEPDVTPIVNSTCTYPQVIAALTDKDPAAAAQVTSNPIATGWLQQLVASPPDGRRAMIKQAQGFPQVQQYSGLISSVATSCNNY